MAKQTFTTGQVLSAAQVNALQANDYNTTVSTKTASYVLVAADVGTTIVQNVATANTVTVNTGLFAAGDTLRIQNIGAGVATVTAGTATVNTANSLAIPQWGSGILYFTSASAAIFFPSAAASVVGCTLYRSASDQTIPNNVYTALSFNTEVFDSNAFHDNSVNPSRITIPTGKAGLYLVTSTIQWDNSGTGRRLINIYINGTQSPYYFNEISPVSGSYPFNLFVNLISLSVGDYIEIFAWQTSGASISPNRNTQFFSAIYLGA